MSDEKKPPGRPRELIGAEVWRVWIDEKTREAVELYQREYKCGKSEAVRAMLKGWIE